MASPPRSDFRRIGCRAPPEVAGSTDTSFAIGPVTQSGRAASQTNQSQWRAIMTKTIFVNLPVTDLAAATRFRSAERRDGKEWVRTCRTRWSQYHSKQNKHHTKKEKKQS